MGVQKRDETRTVPQTRPPGAPALPLESEAAWDARERLQENDTVQNMIFNGLGHALRWLRDRQSKKQYQVAEAAGITKGMLSAYETGRQKPSLDTLEKILGTLECNLDDLHAAIQLVNGRPLDPKGRAVSWAEGSEGGAAPTHESSASSRSEARAELYRLLGRAEVLPAEEERALTEMLAGFNHLVRFLHETIQGLRREPPGFPQE
jgi:transcriptional regulator with XRE-family HTH domain